MYSEIISTINAAINLLHNCGEGNNEITEDLDDVRLQLEAMWDEELLEEDEPMEEDVPEEPTATALKNLSDSISERIEQLKEIKNVIITEAQDGVSVVDEEPINNKKSKMDWLRKGGIF